MELGKTSKAKGWQVISAIRVKSDAMEIVRETQRRMRGARGMNCLGAQGISGQT